MLSPVPSTLLSMFSLEQTDEGVLLPIQAQPGARINGFLGLHAGRLKVAVTQTAEKGKANQALIEVLADQLDLKRSQIKLISGPIAARKVFLIRGVSQNDLQKRIAHRLAERDAE